MCEQCVQRGLLWSRLHGVLAAAVKFMDELPDLWDDGEDGGFSRFQISIQKRAKPEAEEPKAEL